MIDAFLTEVQEIHPTQSSCLASLELIRVQIFSAGKDLGFFKATEKDDKPFWVPIKNKLVALKDKLIDFNSSVLYTAKNAFGDAPKYTEAYHKARARLEGLGLYRHGSGQHPTHKSPPCRYNSARLPLMVLAAQSIWAKYQALKAEAIQRGTKVWEYPERVLGVLGRVFKVVWGVGFSKDFIDPSIFEMSPEEREAEGQRRSEVWEYNQRRQLNSLHGELANAQALGLDTEVIEQEINEMAKGFGSKDNSLQRAINRLSPAVKRLDIDAYKDDLKEVTLKYGEDIAANATDHFMENDREFRSVAIELMMGSFSESQQQHVIEASQEILADVISKAGLPVEHHFRVCDKGMALTVEAHKAIADTGFPQMASLGDPWPNLDEAGLPRPFFHPLSEFLKHDEAGLPEDTMNGYAVASTVVNCAQCWVEGDPKKSLAFLTELVTAVAPTICLETILNRSRYDDKALMKLVNLAENGFQAIAPHQLNK